MRNDKLMLQLMTKQGLVTHQVGEANFGHLNICLAGQGRVTPRHTGPQPGLPVRGESLGSSASPVQPRLDQTSLYVELHSGPVLHW